MIAVSDNFWWSLKIIWTISASIGVAVTVILLYMAVTDYRLLVKQEINSWRQYVAKTSTLIFIGGSATQMVFLTTGVIALTKSNPSPYLKISTASWIQLGLGIFIIWLNSVLALLIFYRRRKVIEIIEAHMDTISKEKSE